MKKYFVPITIIAVSLWVTTGCTNIQKDNHGSEMAIAPLIVEVSCQNGQTREGFLTNTTTGDIPCPSGIQTCILGRWNGPTLFDSCHNYTKSCNGSPHGSTKSGYLAPVATPGFPCPQGMAICIDGQWVGPQLYDFCSNI